MKHVIIGLIAASILSTPVMARDSNRSGKPEAAGVGSGLAVGAVLGGPVGAVIGAALGGWVGDKFGREQSARIESEQQYQAASADVSELSAELRSSEQRILRMRQEIETEEQQYRAALQEALNAEIFFRTGEAKLSDDTIARLGRIATLVGSVDGFVVRLAGHADNRGDEEYNEQLSASRAIAVRDALIAAGFPSSRIAVSVEGERASLANEGDLDALAMERRVQIELISTTDDPRVAQQ